MKLAKPIVGMAPTPDGKGYWLVASDGGVFRLRERRLRGLDGRGRARVAGDRDRIDPDGKGYWFASADGTVFAFGDAGYFGSGKFLGLETSVGHSRGSGNRVRPTRQRLSRRGLRERRVQLAMRSSIAFGAHDRHRPGRRMVFRRGEPVSRAQRPPGPEPGSSSICSCHSATGRVDPSACAGNQDATTGSQRHRTPTVRRRAAGVDASVPWWLDVEEASNDWSSSAINNAAVIRGRFSDSSKRVCRAWGSTRTVRNGTR